jgi:hypothetical protein
MPDFTVIVSQLQRAASHWDSCAADMRKAHNDVHKGTYNLGPTAFFTGPLTIAQADALYQAYKAFLDFMDIRLNEAIKSLQDMADGLNDVANHYATTEGDISSSLDEILANDFTR